MILYLKVATIVATFLPMTIKKKTIVESPFDDSSEDDGYYAVEKKRIAAEAQKAHRIHEEDVQTHLTAMLPYYDDAEREERRVLLLVNSLLIHRFKEIGMVYWGIFRHNPIEIRDYADLFGKDLSEADMNMIIAFLERKKEESENMVEMGFDEDGEEDDLKIQKEEEEEVEVDSLDEEE